MLFLQKNIKILFTFCIIGIYLFVRSITIPGILEESFYFTENATLLQLSNILNGDSLRKYSVLSLNITPIITCMALLQIYTIIRYLRDRRINGIPIVKDIYKTHIEKYFFLLLLYISFIESSIYLLYLHIQPRHISLYEGHYPVKYFVICYILLISGTFFLHILVKLINIYGIGRGISCIIFVNLCITCFDLIKRYLTIIPNALIVIVFLQCIICGILFCYMDLSLRLFTFLGYTFIQSQKEHIRYITSYDTYLLFPTSVLGILPIMLANSFSYILKYNFTTYADIIQNIFAELLIAALLSVLMNRYLKKTIRSFYSINNKDALLPYTKKTADILHILSTYIFHINMKDVFCVTLIIFCSKLSIYVLTVYNWFFCINNIDVTTLSILYSINSSFMLVYLICIRLGLFIFYKTDVLV